MADILWELNPARSSRGNLRLLVVDDKADEVSVVWRAVPLPGQFDPCTAGAVGLKLQDGAFTWRVTGTIQILQYASVKQTNKKKCHRATLTAGSVPIIPEDALLKVALDARLIPHLADLGHAQLWVGSEKQLTRLDGEVVLLPVPKILQLLVVKRRESVHAAGQKGDRINGI